MIEICLDDYIKRLLMVEKTSISITKTQDCPRLIHYYCPFTFRAFSKGFFSKALTISTFVRRKRSNNIAVGTVRMFIEPWAKHQHLYVNPLPVYNKDS